MRVCQHNKAGNSAQPTILIIHSVFLQKTEKYAIDKVCLMKRCSLNAIIEKIKRTITHVMVFRDESATDFLEKRIFLQTMMFRKKSYVLESC